MNRGDGAVLLQEERAGEPGAPILVLLHGRGADRHDLVGLAPYLPETWTVVTPEAPHPGAPWGYGPGWAWYRFLGGRAPEEDSFRTSLRLLAGALAHVRGRHAGPLLLGGFSQGGTMSLAYALARRAGQLPEDAPAVAGVAVLSGFLADHPDVPVADPGVPVFWGHGTDDPAIPLAWGQAGRADLAQTGAAVTAHDYAIGHWIDGQEMADLVTWARAHTAPAGEG